MTIRIAPLLGFLALLLGAPPAFAPAFAKESLLDIRQVESPGGIKAWLVEDRTLPVVALKFGFRGAGAVLDPADRQGLALMASNTMDEGAGEYDSSAFQKALEDNSITLRFASDRDNFTGSIYTLSRRKDLAFELARLALTAPRFDAEPVDRMREANLARIRSSLSDPEWVAARLLNDAAYEGHPYARNSGGTMTTLRAITPDDLRGFVKNRLTRDRLFVSAVGDITEKELAKTLDSIFGALPAAGNAPVPASTPVRGGGQTVLHVMDIPQTMIGMAQDGIARRDPDFHAAQTMNFVLGSSGFGSRLTEEIREKRGLAYGVHTGLDTLEYAPSLTLSTSTKNDSAGEVLSLVRAEWEKMKTGPVTEKELADAQSYLIGSVPLGLTSTGKIASLMLGLQLDGLPPDYLDRREKAIRALTRDDVQRVAKKLLKGPDGQAVVLVGRPQGVKATKTVTALPNVE